MLENNQRRNIRIEHMPHWSELAATLRPPSRELPERRLSFSFSLSKRASAGVALQRINLAIIEHRFRGQGCWERGIARSRVQQQAFAKKPEDVWRRTCLCGAWTLGRQFSAGKNRLEVAGGRLPLFGGVDMVVDSNQLLMTYFGPDQQVMAIWG